MRDCVFFSRVRLAIVFLLIGSAVGSAQIYRRDDNDASGERERARNAALATARGQVARAEQLLNVSLQRVQANWKANPQYLAAVTERETAGKEYDAAKHKVQASLGGDQKYSAAQRSVNEAAHDVHEEQAKVNATQPNAIPGTAAAPSPSADQVAAAQEKLDSKTQVRKIEDDAIAADPDAAKAKARLDKANADLQVLQLQLKAALLNDADYKSALDQLTAAKAQVAQAAGSY